MTEPAGPGQTAPRGFLTLAGVSVARHQLGVALALECQRVICIARELAPELIVMQHEAERAGVQFHVVPSSRAIGGLITANDDVVAFADGLLLTAHEAVALIEGGRGVFVQPVESGLALGFERIDLNHASAGVLRVPGALVERLSELPADCDAASALTRIALQAGVPMREVPLPAREGARWTLIRDEAQAQTGEAEWIRRQVGDRSLQSIGPLLARAGVLALGPALLHGGNGSVLVGLVVTATLLMAIGAGWLGFIAVALLLVALGWVCACGVGMMERIERESRHRPAPRITLERVLGWAIDAVLATVLTLGVRVPGSPWYDDAFPPVMLVALLRLLQRVLDRRWTAWLEDRALIALALGVTAWSGVLDPAVQLLALILIGAGLLVTGGRSRLTWA